MINPSQEKWYFKLSVLIIAILVVGPFALPLLWFNPRYKVSTKVIWTILILVTTYFITLAMSESIKTIIQYYKLAFSPQ